MARPEQYGSAPNVQRPDVQTNAEYHLVPDKMLRSGEDLKAQGAAGISI